MDEIKLKSAEIYTPKPYFKITTEALGYHGMYRLKNILYTLWEESKMNDDFENGYFTDRCDYEGDLEQIIFYISDNPKSHNFKGKVEPFFNAVFDYFQIDKNKIKDDMNIVFCEY